MLSIMIHYKYDRKNIYSNKFKFNFVLSGLVDLLLSLSTNGIRQILKEISWECPSKWKNQNMCY